jgi:formate/nitrite transporter FocA (FNT family)
MVSVCTGSGYATGMADAEKPSSTAESQEPPEEELEEAFDRLVHEGNVRLTRPWSGLLATGFLGGIDVGTGVLAYLVVDHRYHSTILAGVAFSIGFVALLLARSELFTENFLVPVVAVAAARSSLYQLVRLWAATLALNLVGGGLMSWLIVEGLPELKPTAREVGAHYAQLGITGHAFALAILAGAVITLMTRMQHSTDSLGVQLVPAVLFGALLAGASLLHCILDSLFMFAALWSGASFGWLDWLGEFSWAVLGNVVGGLALVTFVRLLRVPHRIADEREKNT